MVRGVGNSRSINNEVYDYVLNTFIGSDSPFSCVRNSLSFERRSIQLSPVEGKMLAVIASIAKARNVLEIGTCVGYSALWIASALPADGTVVTIEKDVNIADVAERNFKKFPQYNIKLINGDALKVISALDNSSTFDMIFIDGQKSFYLDYLLAAEKFLNKGSVIVADNTLLFDTIVDEAFSNKSSWVSMRKFNKYLAQSNEYASILIPTVEGMTVAVKLC